MKKTDQTKTCAVTGRRPEGFPWAYADKKARETYLARLHAVCVWLVENGVTRFVTGGALGIDLDVAEIVVELKKNYPFLSHLLVLPYENQGGRYGLNDKNRHERIREHSEVVSLNSHFTPWCMQQRNEYMVNNADLVVAFVSGEKTGGTYNTVRYATRKNKPVYLFDLGSCLTSPSDAWINDAKKHAVEQLKLL